MENPSRALCLASCLAPLAAGQSAGWNSLAAALQNRGVDLLLLTGEAQPVGLDFPFLSIPDSYIGFAGFAGHIPEVSNLPLPAEIKTLLDADCLRLPEGRDAGTAAVAKSGYYLADAFMRVLTRTLKPAFVLLWKRTLPLSRQFLVLLQQQGIPVQFMEDGLLEQTWRIAGTGLQQGGGNHLQISNRSVPGEPVQAYATIRDYWQRTRPVAEAGSIERFRQDLAPDSKLVVFFGSEVLSDFWRRQFGPGPLDTTCSALRYLFRIMPHLSPRAVLLFVPDASDPAEYLDDPEFSELLVIRDADEALLVDASDVVVALDDAVLLRAVFQQKALLQLGLRGDSGNREGISRVQYADDLAAALQMALQSSGLFRYQQSAENMLGQHILQEQVSVGFPPVTPAGPEILAEAITRCSRIFHGQESAEQCWQQFRQDFERLVKDPETVIAGLQGLGAAATATASPAAITADGASKALEPAAEVATALNERYASWRQQTGITDSQLQLWQQRAERDWSEFPSFHFITSCQQGQEQLLAASLAALQQQIYLGFGLTVLADFPCPFDVFSRDPRLEWRQAGQQSFADQANLAVAESETDWVALLDCGDLAEPNLLYALTDSCNRNRDWRVIYVDDDLVDRNGQFRSARFRPDFNLDLFYSGYYFGGLCLFRRDVFLQAGGYRDFPGAENYDLALRLLETAGEQIFGHVDELLFHQLESNQQLYLAPAVEENCRLVLQGYFARSQTQVEVGPGLLPATHRVEFLHEGQPLVSIIIPTRDRLDLISACLQSLLEKTSYANYEVIVMDNQTTDPEVLAFLENIAATHDRVRVIRYEKPYNYSAINNLAVAEARGEYLVLLNNDTVVIQDNWLERMLTHARRPEVGVVGVRLVFPDSRIQHAGVILGFGPADHVHMQLQINDPGYMGRAQVVQDMSVVTAACLMIRTSVFRQVEGLDEDKFPILYNDVDLCLKVGQAGYKVVWTPFATLIHHGSSSLRQAKDSGNQQTGADSRQPEKNRPKGSGNDVLRKASANMFDKWLPLISSDPAHNRHLSLRLLYPQPEAEMVPQWNPRVRELPRVMGSPILGASAYYRVRYPLEALSEHGHVQRCFAPSISNVSLNLPDISELARLAPDSMLFQSFAHDDQLVMMQLYRKYLPELFMVYELDDLKSEMPKKNPISRTMFTDFRKRLRRALEICDRFVVTTEPLKQAYADLADDIRVIPNYLNGSIWQGLRSQRRVSAKPRVGWAGALQHQGDLEVIFDTVRETSEEVDWVFFGMCPEEIRPLVREFHEPVAFEQYPQALSALNLDLAVAPLEHHRFNEAKSNLRLLEYGAMGWPVVATDIHPYRESHAPGVKLVRNTTSAWVDAIRERINDPGAAALAGDQLYLWVMQNWLLEQHLDEWLEAMLPEWLLAAARQAEAGRIINVA